MPKGQISLRGGGLGHERIQEQLLRREGVAFVGDTIALERHLSASARGGASGQAPSRRRGRGASGPHPQQQAALELGAQEGIAPDTSPSDMPRP